MRQYVLIGLLGVITSCSQAERITQSEGWGFTPINHAPVYEEAIAVVRPSYQLCSPCPPASLLSPMPDLYDAPIPTMTLPPVAPLPPRELKAETWPTSGFVVLNYPSGETKLQSEHQLRLQQNIQACLRNTTPEMTWFLWGCQGTGEDQRIVKEREVNMTIWLQKSGLHHPIISLTDPAQCLPPGPRIEVLPCSTVIRDVPKTETMMGTAGLNADAHVPNELKGNLP